MSRKPTPYEISQLQAARARYREMLANCEHCPFATYTGTSGIWYCPLGVCLHDTSKEEPHHDPN